MNLFDLNRNQLMAVGRRRGVPVNVRMTREDLLAVLVSEEEIPVAAPEPAAGNPGSAPDRPLVVEPDVLEPDHENLGFPGQVGSAAR